MFTSYSVILLTGQTRGDRGKTKSWPFLTNCTLNHDSCLFLVCLSLLIYSLFTGQSKKKKSLNLVEKSELKLLLKVLPDSVCLLESCQWKWRRGEVSRLAVFCSLLFRLTLSGQPLSPLIQVVCSPRCPLSPPLALPQPPLAHKHALHQRLPPRAVVSSLHQSKASAAMGTLMWANEQHLFLKRGCPCQS